MKYIATRFSLSTMITCLLFCPFTELNAQTPSTYDPNGKVKSIEQRRYEETQNKKNTYAPKTEPAKTTAPVTKSYEKTSRIGYDEYGKVDNNNTRAVRSGDKWGYLWGEYTITIEVKYDAVKFTELKRFGVKLDGKWGFVDKDGTVIVPLVYDDLLSGFRMENGKAVAQVQQDGVTFKIDEKGKEVGYRFKPTKPGPVIINGKTYDTKGVNSSAGLTRVSIAGKYGYVNQQGIEAIPLIYDYVQDGFTEGWSAVALNGKWGIINTTGKVVIPVMYEAISADFREGLAAVKLNGKYGFINKAGKIMIPCTYLVVSPFSEGLACVEVNDKYGAINKTGKLVIPPTYEYSFIFSNGLAAVWLGGKTGVIDKKGKVIVPVVYDNANIGKDGKISVLVNGEFIVLDKTGKPIAQ